ncbi:hypothetical protein C8Q76DRAFT_624510, partial [Earliella scabrosa]
MSRVDLTNHQPVELNKADVCPGFVFRAHPNQPDEHDPAGQAADCAMYPREHAPEIPAGSLHARIDWSEIEILVRCKTSPDTQDPFEDAPPHEPTSDSRNQVFSQTLSYAEHIHQHQQRTFFFMILFLGDFARLVRFDRSTIFVTTTFNYKTEGAKITHFLRLYARLPAERRGYDPTATRIRPNTKLWKAMMSKKESTSTKPDDHVKALFEESLDPTWPWWQLEVPMGLERRKRYLVGKPHFLAPGVAGRGTRGYVALPVDGKGKIADTFVYLKDAWRVDHPGISKEGDTLRKLKKKKVPYVPTLLCHGDLPGSNQLTDWRRYWRTLHPEVNAEAPCPLKRHRHYRLVVKEVGLPLDRFEDSSMLVVAIFCCLKAHRAAYRAGIIHRDISAGNILLYPDSQGTMCGLLNDWELAKNIKEEGADPRQPDRTGTWQFMSVHALNDPSRRIVLEDELESFLHVIIYHSVRFLESNLDSRDVRLFLRDYFDSFSPSSAGYRCGTVKATAMASG